MSYTVKYCRGLVQLPEAAEIRRKVFIQEQGFVNEFDETDSEAVHVLISDHDKAMATGRLFEDEIGWHIGRVAVLSEYRGKGLGAMIITSLEDYAKKLGVKSISLSAQVQASGFYLKLGYENTGDLHTDEHCPHMTMNKIL